MQRFSEVPPIAPQRQQFSRDTLPPVQSALAMPGQQTSPEQAIMEQMQELALEIYSQLAVAHIQHNQATDRETLQELAKAAQTAARAYFEQMGVKFNG